MSEEKKEAQRPDRPDYQDEILEIVRTSPEREVSELLDDFHAYDLAQSLAELDQESRKQLFDTLETDQLAEIFEYLETEELTEYLRQLHSGQIVAILNRMEPDKTAALLKTLPQDMQDQIIPRLHPAISRGIGRINSYNEDQIGSKMTTNYISIPRGLSVKAAMRALRRQAMDHDNIDNIYVSENGTYYGTIELKDLIVARNTDDLESIISTSFPYLYATESMDEALEELKDYNEGAVPILNKEKQIEGVITVQDLLEMMDEEMGEDYARLAGLSAEEDINERLGESLRKRLPWLLFLLVLGLVVSSVVSIFEVVVAALTIVMVFQSLILDMAGNVGTQSLAVTIRVLLDESLETKDQIRFIFKEGRVGFSNGLIIGALAFAVITVYVYFKGYGWIGSLAIAGCVAVALLLAMTTSAFTGTTIPIVLKRMHIDPAVASGPLITTINDLVGIVIYYGLSWIFLIRIMGL